MTKIKGTKEHGLLQVIRWMIRPPPCSSVPLKMVVCKEDGSPYDQNQGDAEAEIVSNDHPEDPASSIPSQMVVCKVDCPSDDQNQRDGGARVVANDHLDGPAISAPCSSVPLQMVVSKEDCPSDDQNQRDGLLQMTIWMTRPLLYPLFPLQMVICKEDGPPDDQHFFWMWLKFAPDLPLV